MSQDLDQHPISEQTARLRRQLKLDPLKRSNLGLEILGLENRGQELLEQQRECADHLASVAAAKEQELKDHPLAAPRLTILLAEQSRRPLFEVERRELQDLQERVAAVDETANSLLIRAQEVSDALNLLRHELTVKRAEAAEIDAAIQAEPQIPTSRYTTANVGPR